MRRHPCAHRICQTQLTTSPSGVSICTFVPVKQVKMRKPACGAIRALLAATDNTLLRCQYLYFCTSKAIKLSTCSMPASSGACIAAGSLRFLPRIFFLYFCTSKASKLSTCSVRASSGRYIAAGSFRFSRENVSRWTTLASKSRNFARDDTGNRLASGSKTPSLSRPPPLSLPPPSLFPPHLPLSRALSPLSLPLRPHLPRGLLFFCFLPVSV